MEQQRLTLYTVDMKLIRNMHNQGDDRVFSVSPQTKKSNRPFVGVIVICNNKQYCVPLSSPKSKHNTIQNEVDFHRVLDTKGKLIGVLNFNNMIPVRRDVVKKLDIKIHPSDSKAVKNYKALVLKQLTFCQQNQDVIVEKANALYKLIASKKAKKTLKERCLDWDKLEKVLDRYTASPK